MAHGIHHQAAAPDSDPAPGPGPGPTSNLAPVLSTSVAAPATAVPALPPPSMAASLAHRPVSRAPLALHSGEDDAAAQGEHVVFHQHRMDTRVLARLWQHG